MLASYSIPTSLPTPTVRWRAPISLFSMGLVMAVLLRMFVAVDSWTNLRVTKYDVFGYYLYLPATFIYHDVSGLGFVTPILDQYDLTNRGNPAHPLGNYEVSRARTNPESYVIKYTMGLSILYAPFFGAAHLYTKYLSSYPADGYSLPYQLAAYLAGLVYALLGLVLLRRLLLLYFSDALTAVLLVVVYCTTNYLCYAVFKSLYSHNFLFVLHTATLLLTHYWLQRPRLRYILGLALTIGLAVLIRPTEVIIMLVPLLLGVASWAGLQARIQLLWAKRLQVVCFGLGVFLVMVPQLLYWHHTSGRWTYDSYPGESFDFLHPKLYSGLLSFDNGWLTYTPVMVLALVGLFILWRQRRDWFWLVSLYLGLHVYIAYSWWCWWYMDSFGSRTMVQTYPLLSLPLGFCLQALFQRGVAVRMLTASLLVLLTALNGFQLWQRQEGIFMPEHMTRRYYFAILGKTHLTKDDLTKFDTNEADPDRTRYVSEVTYFNNFSQESAPGVTNEFALAAPAFQVDSQHPYSPTYRQKLGDLKVKPGDWIEASAQVFFPDKAWDINQMPSLVIEFKRNGQTCKWKGMRLMNKVGEVSTVYGGTPKAWDEVRFDSKVSNDAQPDDEVSVYAFQNGSTQPVLVDNLMVTMLRHR